MRLNDIFGPVLRVCRRGAAGPILFGSGPAVFASGQTPAPQQTTSRRADRSARPPPDRAGDALSADDAVRMALENNLGIQAERLKPQIQVLGDRARERGVRAGAVLELSTASSTQPPSTSSPAAGT